MFVVWGTRGFEKDLGDTNITGTCSHCNNEVTMRAKKIGRKFTLFWIPLFPVKTAHYILCPICSAGKQVDKNEMEQYLTADS